MRTIQKVLQPGFYAAMLLIISGLNANAQKVIEVKNIQAQMSKGSQTSYIVEIPQADLKTVQQNWIKKIQEDNRIKVKEAGQELVLAGVLKPELTKDTVNIYSLLIQKDSMISLNVFVEIDSVFFSPKEDKTDLASDKIDNSIKNYMRSFAVDQYKLAVTAELEGEQEILETLEKDLEKLEKDEENMTKDNSSLENDIEETEREVSEIDKNIELKQQEIQTHNTSMLTIVGDAAKEAANDKKKVLEKEKKQLEKDRNRAKDDISSYKSDIEKNKKDIEEGVKLQEEKKEEMAAQTEVVLQVQSKLNGIK